MYNHLRLQVLEIFIFSFFVAQLGSSDTLPTEGSLAYQLWAQGTGAGKGIGCLKTDFLNFLSIKNLQARLSGPTEPDIILPTTFVEFPQ